MKTIRRDLHAETTVLSEARQVRVTVSTDEVGRDNLVMVTDGIDLRYYRQNPVVLWQHDPEKPIARAANIGVDDAGRLSALVQFPDEGVSALADEVYGLIRSGIINAASIGADPLDTEPLGKDGAKILRAEMCEFSFVSIPAVRGALITERSAGEPHQERKTMRTPIVRSLVKRGLYDVAQLAQLLQELGWIADCTNWEAEAEKDGSQLPAMLGEALHQLGEALKAMTIEEVAELLANQDAETIAADATEDASYVEAAATPAMKRWRAGRAAMARRLGVPIQFRVQRSAAREALLQERLRRVGAV